MMSLYLLLTLLTVNLLRVHAVDQHEMKLAIKYDQAAFHLMTNGNYKIPRDQVMAEIIRRIVSRANKETRKANAGLVVVETGQIYPDLPPPNSELPSLSLIQDPQSHHSYRPREKVDFYQLWTGRNPYRPLVEPFHAEESYLCDYKAFSVVSVFDYIGKKSEQALEDQMAQHLVQAIAVNSGLREDNRLGIDCSKCSDDSCVTTDWQPPTGGLGLPDCAKEFFDKTFTGSDNCTQVRNEGKVFTNQPIPICGNGVRENAAINNRYEEECDCRFDDQDCQKCCDAITCKRSDVQECEWLTLDWNMRTTKTAPETPKIESTGKKKTSQSPTTPKTGSQETRSTTRLSKSSGPTEAEATATTGGTGVSARSGLVSSISFLLVLMIIRL